MKKFCIVFVVWVSLGNFCWAQNNPSKIPADSGFAKTEVLSSSSSQENNNSSAVWQADQSFDSQLGGDVSLGNVSLRPPKEYLLTKLPGPDGTLILTWRGPVRDDLTFAHLLTTIVAQSKEDKKSYESKEALRILLSGIEANRNEWSASKAEEGKINGLNFIRSYWTGVDKTSGMKMKGFVYVIVDNKIIINLSSQDTLSNVSALKLAEAAVLTCHK